MLRRLAVSLLGSLFILGSEAWSGEVNVAVAANFHGPMQRLAQRFQQESGHVVSLSSGATGKFYAQIRNGAPFDVLLAADDATPARLEREGLGVAGSRFTYALGRLVLWSAKPARVDSRGEVLGRADFQHLALANPKLAPYGRAAQETLQALGLAQRLAGKLVQGESIAQAQQFVASGNAELGFVAMAQVYLDGKLQSGSAWVVPGSLHQPIRQDALLLQHGRANPAAQALLQFLRTDAARQIMAAYGYTW